MSLAERRTRLKRAMRLYERAFRRLFLHRLAHGARRGDPTYRALHAAERQAAQETLACVVDVVEAERARRAARA